MVRFSWHVEDGLNAYLPPGAYSQHKESSVRHAACEIEVQNGKDTLEAIFSLPANYLDAEQVKETGIVLGHGNNASEWKGKLLTDIAVFLAMQGYLVLRYCCRHKEGRRQKMFEKSLDACATSPFARGISRWVLAGVGSGARVAAAVGSQCRGHIAGFIFISYPLKEFLPPPTKARRGEDEDDFPPLKSSEEPLQTLEAPILFLMGDSDKFCSPAEMRGIISTLASQDIRLDLFEDANQDFKNGQGKGPAGAVVRRLCSNMLDFVAALDDENMKKCQIPKAAEILGVRAPEKGQRQDSGPAEASGHDVSEEPPQASQAVRTQQNSSQQPRAHPSSNAGLEMPAPNEGITNAAAAQPGLEQAQAPRPNVQSGQQRVSIPQAHVHNVHHGPQIPILQQQVGGAAATAAGPSPQLQSAIAPDSQASSSAATPVSGPAQAQLPHGSSVSGYGHPGGLQVPQLYQQISQQMLSGQMLSNPQQAQQLLKALAAQHMSAQQNFQQPSAGSWNQSHPQQHNPLYSSQQYHRPPAYSGPPQPGNPASLQSMMMQQANTQHRGAMPAYSASASAGAVDQGRPQSQARLAPTGAQMLHMNLPRSFAPQSEPSQMEQ